MLRIFQEDPLEHKPFIELSPEIVSVILRTVSEGWKHALSVSNIHSKMGEVLLTELCWKLNFFKWPQQQSLKTKK